MTGRKIGGIEEVGAGRDVLEVITLGRRITVADITIQAHGRLLVHQEEDRVVEWRLAIEPSLTLAPELRRLELGGQINDFMQM